MENEHANSIAALERQLADLERKKNAIRSAINVLCEASGAPPRYSENTGGEGDGGQSVITQIKDDTFYGKKQQTAIRIYLEMRKAQGLGPAKPREIFDALKAGGYQFETKDDNVAMIGMRALLRKRTNFFHKLPTGSYGLTAWYENIKAAKATDADEAEEAEDGADENEDKAEGKSAA